MKERSDAAIADSVRYRGVFRGDARRRAPHPQDAPQYAPAEQLPHVRRAGRDAALRPRRSPALPHVAELAICTSARASNADYIWNGHVRLGLQAGTREEALHVVDTHGPLDGLTADEALIIRFGRELLESPQVSDDTFNAVRARYGEQGLLELTAVMSVYTMNANILRVMDHQAAADARHLTPR
jgi:4-carboxymuconolactone decarboxylase